MKLQFNPEAKVTEYMNGTLYFKNEGQPIEVENHVGEILLRSMHTPSPETFVPVFVPAEQAKKPKEAKTESKEN